MTEDWKSRSLRAEKIANDLYECLMIFVMGDPDFMSQIQWDQILNALSEYERELKYIV